MFVGQQAAMLSVLYAFFDPCLLYFLYCLLITKFPTIDGAQGQLLFTRKPPVTVFFKIHCEHHNHELWHEAPAEEY